MEKKLRCPRCGSDNVNAQVVSEQVHVEKGHHGWLYFMFVGWWLWFAKAMFALCTWPLHMFGRRDKVYTSTRHHTECVCQNCGHHWALK